MIFSEKIVKITRITDTENYLVIVSLIRVVLLFFFTKNESIRLPKRTQ